MQSPSQPTWSVALSAMVSGYPPGPVGPPASREPQQCELTWHQQPHVHKPFSAGCGTQSKSVLTKSRVQPHRTLQGTPQHDLTFREQGIHTTRQAACCSAKDCMAHDHTRQVAGGGDHHACHAAIPTTPGMTICCACPQHCCWPHSDLLDIMTLQCCPTLPTTSTADRCVLYEVGKGFHGHAHLLEV